MTPKQAAAAALKGRTRLVNDTTAELRALLEQAAREVAAILAGAPSDYQAWQLPRLQAEIRRALASLGSDAAAVVDQKQVAAWRAGQQLVDDVTRSAGISLAMPVVDTGQLTAMRAFLTEKISGITVDAANAINTQLGLVTIGAQTPFDAVKAVTATLKEDTRKRATTIVHTELARAYSTANQLRMEQTAAAGVEMKKRWLWSGKLNPRPEHMAIDGQEVDVDKPFLLEGGAVQMMYPHDPSAPARHTINCGCVSVPVVAEFKSTLPAAAREADERERARARAALTAAR